MSSDAPAYGLWSLVLINSAIFLFFAFRDREVEVSLPPCAWVFMLGSPTAHMRTCWRGPHAS